VSCLKPAAVRQQACILQSLTNNVFCRVGCPCINKSDNTLILFRTRLYARKMEIYALFCCSPATAAFYTTKKGREYKCKPGYGSATGFAPCRLCPIGTYSEGGTMEDCKPCSFGHTSAAGSDSRERCLPLSQPCPVGQIAPPDAVSPRQCGCAPGHGGGWNKIGPESARICTQTSFCFAGFVCSCICSISCALPVLSQHPATHRTFRMGFAQAVIAQAGAAGWQPHARKPMCTTSFVRMLMAPGLV